MAEEAGIFGRSYKWNAQKMTVISDSGIVLSVLIDSRSFVTQTG